MPLLLLRNLRGGTTAIVRGSELVLSLLSLFFILIVSSIGRRATQVSNRLSLPLPLPLALSRSCARITSGATPQEATGEVVLFQAAVERYAAYDYEW